MKISLFKLLAFFLSPGWTLMQPLLSNSWRTGYHRSKEDEEGWGWKSQEWFLLEAVKGGVVRKIRGKPERLSRSGQGWGSAGSNSLVRSSRLKVWEGLLNLAARKFSRSVKEEKGGQPMEASLPRTWTSMGTRKSRIKTKQPFRVSDLRIEI